MKCLGAVLVILVAIQAADTTEFDPYHCSWYPKGGSAGIEEAWQSSFRLGDTVRIRVWVQNLCEHNHYLYGSADGGKTYKGLQFMEPIEPDSNQWEPCRRENCTPFGDIKECGISNTPPCFSIYPYGWYRWVEWTPERFCDTVCRVTIAMACSGCKHELVEQSFAFRINVPQPQSGVNRAFSGNLVRKRKSKLDAYYTISGRKTRIYRTPVPVLSARHGLFVTIPGREDSQ